MILVKEVTIMMINGASDKTVNTKTIFRLADKLVLPALEEILNSKVSNKVKTEAEELLELLEFQIKSWKSYL